ncbi:hypothetical protein FUA23_06580 [Neolewinella aurantiaca]|uniref:Uncharacterized protein n=1 Tax=Neolewinella aurantiaca TaxID=2602767 RepID=A0A5C7FV07_9BACT|nr:hypothetical protein [Neolewinella aurantiaca]TXF90450.1 hypothetical protein FUA23_06580 [Neolewinella aurantiaca]
MELTKDERAALAEDYITIILDKYKADFTDRYNRSQEPDQLLNRERETYKRAAFDEDAGTLVGLVTYRRAGGSWSPALGAKYGNLNPYGWENDIAGLVCQYVIRAGDITRAVDFTEVVPGETIFKPGDAVAVYRYFKWLEAGKIGPEITTKPDPKEQILKMFLARRDGSGGSNDLYRAVADAVPKVDGGRRSDKSVKTLYSKWKARPAWITPDVTDRIVKELEDEGKPIDNQYLFEITGRY